MIPSPDQILWPNYDNLILAIEFLGAKAYWRLKIKAPELTFDQRGFLLSPYYYHPTLGIRQTKFRITESF